MRQRLQRRRPAVEGLQRGWGIGGGMPTLGAILARLTKRGTLEPTGRHRVNTPEQNKPPKTPVSQWAQVRACILGTCVFGLPGYMTASFIVPQLGESSYIARWIIPDQFFFSLAHLIFGDGYHPRLQDGGPLAWWLTGCFIVIWAIRYGSIASKLALLGCAALGIGMVSLSEKMDQQVDYTERRLDVSRPNFEPGLLILAGTVTPLNATEPEGTFEIRIAGPDYYFLHQSWPDTPHYRASRDTQIATPNWAGWNGRRPRVRNSALGCGRPPDQLEIADSKPLLMPGRGLWNETALRGALFEGQTTDYSPPNPDRFWSSDRHEEYFRLEQIGRWQIPREIIFQDKLRFGELVYSVRRIELLVLPEHEWFEKAKAAHFKPGHIRPVLSNGKVTYPARGDSAPAPPAPPPGR